MARAGFSWLLVLGAFVGCRPSGGGGGYPPPPPFPDREAKCGVAKSQSEPLIVEWPSSSRAKLEALTRHGVVVVAYQGCEMRVLGHCRAPGKYAFTPTTRKRDVVSIRDADELYANIPTGAARLEAKLQSSGELNVTMTVVGRYEASEPFVDANALVGECTGATHVISGLTAGAFKFFAGAEAEIGGGVDVMGAGAGAKSASQSELLNEDGDELACAKSTTADPAPPDGCGAILRVEVVPLGALKKATPTCPKATVWDGTHCAASGVTCPGGSKWNGTACVGAATEAPLEPCPKGDAKTCAARCEKGQADSCTRLGASYAIGAGGLPIDRTKAAALYAKACEAGSANGCAHLGSMYERGEGGLAKDAAKARALYVKACDAGGAEGCTMLGNLYRRGEGGVAHDEAKALALYQKACDAGSADGCERLGIMHEFGYGGLPADKKKGDELQRKACDAGSAWACCMFAREYTTFGDPKLASDVPIASELYHRACDMGEGLCCEDLGWYYAKGRLGLPSDAAKSKAMYQRACDLGWTRACEKVTKTP